MAMTAVFKRGINPYHTHQESEPGVEQLRYSNLAPAEAFHPVFRLKGELIRRRERCIKINHRVSLLMLTWSQLMRRLLKNVFRRHNLPSGREVLKRLLGWLKSRRECAEQRKQMVRMFNSEYTPWLMPCQSIDKRKICPLLMVKCSVAVIM